MAPLTVVLKTCEPTRGPRSKCTTRVLLTLLLTHDSFTTDLTAHSLLTHCSLTVVLKTCEPTRLRSSSASSTPLSTTLSSSSARREVCRCRARR